MELTADRFSDQTQDIPFVVIILVVIALIFAYYMYDKQGFARKLEGIQRTLNYPQVRYYILVGMIIFIIIMFIDYFLKYGTFETGIMDWGMDMGITWIGWGAVFVILIGAIVIYPKQSLFKNPTVTKAVNVILGSWIILIAFLFLIGFQTIAHHPDLDYYHGDTLVFGADLNDKLAHFIGTIAFTVFFVSLFYAMGPKYRVAIPYVAIIVLLGSFMYELYEIVFIWFLKDTILADPNAMEQFTYEINDVPFDMVINTVGWLIGILLVKNKIWR